MSELRWGEEAAGGMLRTDFRVTCGAVSPAAMAAAEAWLARAGWRSAGRAAAEAFAAASGAADQAGTAPLRARGTVAGGIYFSPAAADRGDAGAPGEWFYAIAKTPGPRREPELEIGAIGQFPGRAAQPQATLRVWMAAWAAALAVVAPDLSTRWRDPARPVRLEQLIASGAYVRPRLHLAAFDEAALMSEPGAPEWFARLRRAGPVRLSDLANDPGARVHLARVARAQSAPKPEPASTTGSAPAASMSAGDWPLLWLTERLSALGCAAIAWPVASGASRTGSTDPPPHLAAEFCGQIWSIVCMPGAWDSVAEAAWERRAPRNRAQMVIIALGGIAAPPPPAAEGRTARDLDSGARLLAGIFAAAARDYAAQRLAPLERAYGWPLAAMLARRFG